MKTLAIFNTIHYIRKGLDKSNLIISRIKDLFNADVLMTQFHGHATQLASEAKDYELIISIGGDGTLFEVINGLDLLKQKIAVIPYGSGNGFALHLGIKNIDAAIETIKNNRVEELDLLKVVYKTVDGEFERYVVTSSSFGYITEAVNFANNYLKPIGPSCYSIAAVLEILKQKKFKAHLKINGEHANEIEATTIVVNNTKYSGNFYAFPGSDLKDGKFELLVAENNPLQQAMFNIAILTKAFYYGPAVPKKVEKVEILIDPPQKFMSDGEIFEGVFAAEFSVAPKKLLCCT